MFNERVAKGDMCLKMCVLLVLLSSEDNPIIC